LVSVEVMATVSVTELTTFQYVSTAFAVTLNAETAEDRGVGHVLPVDDPAAAVSPGISSCSLVNAIAFTVVDGLVLAVFVPSVMSVAVTVWPPPPPLPDAAVLSVTLNVPVPATSAAFDGSAAFASLEVMPTVSVTELTTFQLASTAFTVTLNDV